MRKFTLDTEDRFFEIPGRKKIIGVDVRPEVCAPFVSGRAIIYDNNEHTVIGMRRGKLIIYDFVANDDKKLSRFDLKRDFKTGVSDTEAYPISWIDPDDSRVKSMLEKEPRPTKYAVDRRTGQIVGFNDTLPMPFESTQPFRMKASLNSNVTNHAKFCNLVYHLVGYDVEGTLCLISSDNVFVHFDEPEFDPLPDTDIFRKKAPLSLIDADDIRVVKYLQEFQNEPCSKYVEEKASSQEEPTHPHFDKNVKIILHEHFKPTTTAVKKDTVDEKNTCSINALMINIVFVGLSMGFIFVAQNFNLSVF